ncbi:hypothetical protein RSP03_06150 [Cereibacter sphaeroides]|nr:hypothetical protein RSP03_06150 [Cereibacter sphaeroides]
MKPQRLAVGREGGDERQRQALRVEPEGDQADSRRAGGGIGDGQRGVARAGEEAPGEGAGLVIGRLKKVSGLGHDPGNA